MPSTLFRAHASACAPAFSDLSTVAAAYDVSLTACSIRYVSFTGEACALICSEQGRIAWSAKSRSLRYGLPAWGSPVPPDSIASHVWSGEEINLEAETVNLYAWIDARHDVDEVLESTFRPTSGQVLSLIWVLE